MTGGVKLDRAGMREANRGLIAAIAEFTDAAKLNDSLESSIGRPDDRGALRDKANDFERSWDSKRAALLDNLTGTQEHLQAIIDGWDEFEREAAASMNSGAGASAQRAV